MGLDFTVVFGVRQRFGDREPDDDKVGLEPGAPFVGSAKEYLFQCPSVDPNQFGILLFQSQGVSPDYPPGLTVNGQAVPGGIPGSIDRDTADFGFGVTRQDYATWRGSVMLILPGVLQANNVLRIQAASAAGNIQDFIVDNMVVVFKTKSARPSVLLRARKAQRTIAATAAKKRATGRPKRRSKPRK
jgi:hypothetical protein